MEEDGQQVEMAPKQVATPKKKETAQIVALPPNDDITFIPASEFPGAQHASGSCENPIDLSDTTTEVSNLGMHPLRDVDVDNKAKMLGHFSDALHEMATSIIDLEDGYFKALHEVIVEM